MGPSWGQWWRDGMQQAGITLAVNVTEHISQRVNLTCFRWPGGLDKPARLIIRLLFGFVSDSETSATTP